VKSPIRNFNNLHSIIIMKKASPKTTKASAPEPKAKPAKTKAPAVIAKVVAAKKALVKPAAKPVVTAAKRPAVAAVKTPALKVTAASAPGVKAPAKKAAGTVITALVDVGFGNTLYVRGEGAGLSWDSGIPLASVADNKWEISLPATSSPLVYKFLINDFNWSVGEDFKSNSGTNVTVSPAF
jgi:hypothetical protein